MERIHSEVCHCSIGLLGLFSMAGLLITGLTYILVS